MPGVDEQSTARWWPASCLTLIANTTCPIAPLQSYPSREMTSCMCRVESPEIARAVNFQTPRRPFCQLDQLTNTVHCTCCVPPTPFPGGHALSSANEIGRHLHFQNKFSFRHRTNKYKQLNYTKSDNNGLECSIGLYNTMSSYDTQYS